MDVPELATMVAVGAVTHRSARLWLRSDAHGPHTMILHAPEGPARTCEIPAPMPGADGTRAWTVPDDAPGMPALSPSTEYRYEVQRADGSVLGGGRFATAPLPGAVTPFAFGLMSCHAPFAPDGSIRDSARRMLTATANVLRARRAQFVLAVGDQMYVDHPDRLSLFDEAYFRRIAPPGRAHLLDCSRAEIRALYQQRYRQAWAVPELAQLYANVPVWPMLDDHEVVNNFGGVAAHASPAWSALREGALDAYHDYQGARVLSGPTRPGSFDHGLRWGGAAIYQLDVRAQRRVGPDGAQVYAPAQLLALAEFLRAHADARVLVLTVSVPIAYVPRWFSTTSYLFTRNQEGTDRWSFPNAVGDRDRLLRLLLEHARAHPHQRIVLTSGDVHVGSAFELAWRDGPAFLQLTSSAITNELSRKAARVFGLVPRVERKLRVGDERARVRRIPGAGDAPSENPFSGLNIGIVEIDDDGHAARVRFELASAADSGEPRTVYRSDWL